MPLRDRRKVPTPSPPDSRRVFVACYSGPIYCDAPPDIGAPENNLPSTTATSVSGSDICDAPPDTRAPENNLPSTTATSVSGSDTCDAPSDTRAPERSTAATTATSVTGPITCNVLPDIGASESKAFAAARSSFSVAQNSGHIYVYENVHISQDNNPECTNKRKFNDSKIHLEKDSRKSVDESLNTEVATPKKIRMDKDLIDEHILSYKLIINRDTIPVSRYLPKHLTVNAMYDDFKSKNPSVCSDSFYRHQLRKMNVVFQPHKNDKNCAECLSYEATVKKYEEHKASAESAITKFHSDSYKAQSTDKTVSKYYSMALQKDILLPDIPINEKVCKDYFRVSKLVCFNMTFTPLNGSKDPSICVVWHEALAGKNYNNIVDAIVSLIRTETDVIDFNFWAEDCTALYKNWTLFTALTILVNSNTWQTRTITIKYLTKGHIDTKLADSMHYKIENKMKKEKAIYDFKNLKNIFENMRNVRVVEVNQFGDWPKNYRNDPKMDKLLSSVIEVKFVRGSRKPHYRTNFEEPLEELDLPVGKLKFDTFSPTFTTNPRGIQTVKKYNIISKLVQHIRQRSPKTFWINLPENDNSPDLMTDEQMD